MRLHAYVAHSSIYLTMGGPGEAPVRPRVQIPGPKTACAVCALVMHVDPWACMLAPVVTVAMLMHGTSSCEYPARSSHMFLPRSIVIMFLFGPSWRCLATDRLSA